MDYPQLTKYYLENRRDYFRTKREMRKLFIRAAYTKAIKKQIGNELHSGSSSTCKESNRTLKKNPFTPSSKIERIDEEEEEEEEDQVVLEIDHEEDRQQSATYSVADEVITLQLGMNNKKKNANDEEVEQETFLPKPNAKVNRSKNKNKAEKKDGDEEEQESLLPKPNSNVYYTNNKPENKDSEEDEQDSLLPTNSKEDGSYKTELSSPAPTIALVCCIIAMLVIPIVLVIVVIVMNQSN